jgi:hypothetical protein
MKSFFCTLFLMLGLLAQGQSAEKSTSVTPQLSLSQKYAPKLLKAYQENGQTKVTDLFAYFQMLTDASVPDEYKLEIAKNIRNLFKGQNPQVIDFTATSLDKIPLGSLIDKLLFSEPILFNVSGNWQNDDENPMSWLTSYTVSRTKSGVTENIKVVQLVYLFEETKTFGSNAKNVTVSFLGKMQ